MGKVVKWVGIAFGTAVALGIGVTIGWFSKPDAIEDPVSDLPDPENDGFDFKLIDEFTNAVDKKFLEQETEHLSTKIRWATSQGDYEMADYIINKWKDQLDDAWSLDYQIVHSYPEEENCYARLVGGAKEFTLRKKEDAEELQNDDQVLMFYNAWAPSTEAPISTSKLVYGHYCNEDNVNWLLDQDSDIFDGAVVICKYGGGAGRPDKGKNVKPHGAAAVLIFSDPYDASDPSDKDFPEGPGIPEDTVQRGSAKYKRGDPTSPGYPSIDGAYFDDLEDLLNYTRTQVESPHIWAPLPSQPIAWGDAKYLLSQLEGGPVNSEWISETALDTLENFGGSLKDNQMFELQIAVKYERKKSQDVIGIIEGSEYPDEYVLIGNHRDTWVKGAIDAGAGMTTIFEISRLFKELEIRPKRTVVFCSWGSEEHGLMGSIEFTEEFLAVLKERAILYVNADVSFKGNEYFYSSASQQMHELVFELTDYIKDHNDESMTVTERWAEKTEATGRPTIGNPGLGSDYAPFHQFAGVPIVDVGFNQKTRKVSQYSTYHTGYDNLEYLHMIDPGFSAAKKVTEIAGAILIRAACSDYFPVDPSPMADYVDSLDEKLPEVGSEVSTEQQNLIKRASASFKNQLRAAKQIYDDSDSMDKKRSFMRLLNYSKYLTDQNCCHPIQHDLQNVVVSSRQEGGPATYPGISNYFGLGDKEEIQRQVGILITRLNAAADYLNLKPFSVRANEL
ncbi:Oidioi.mRNA.OKI2018_I69.chr1.g1888.t1.cds [Oikopleura dioica]|uniref:Oidioi.mRNA.OKI2018_I69.chr1.g1888.t1.cds n=1 Tax=Oikopleura dioica TaxID=34765 RepID=A0ABN7SW97_OIKDI|nr:Oidioi.mRNA.OKI2018_I69.chr1.g1888.t1.cds [Oikopleura dioica]